MADARIGKALELVGNMPAHMQSDGAAVVALGMIASELRRIADALEQRRPAAAAEPTLEAFTRQGEEA